MFASHICDFFVSLSEPYCLSFSMPLNIFHANTHFFHESFTPRIKNLIKFVLFSNIIREVKLVNYKAMKNEEKILFPLYLK